MELVEKAVKGLEAHVIEAACSKCPYQNVRGCVVSVKEDALKALHECVHEIDELRAQVYNLTLYLSEAFFADGEVLMLLEQMHPGLPGFCPAEVFDDGKDPDAE